SVSPLYRDQKKRRARCAAFIRAGELLLRDRTTEHAVDLLVGRIAAGLRSLGSGQRLIRGALRTTGGGRRRLRGGVRGISRALGGSEIGRETADLLLEIVDVGLQRLQVL